MNCEAQKMVIQSAPNPRRRRCGSLAPVIAFACLALPARAHASIFHGETLDSIANGFACVVLHNKANLMLAFLVRPKSNRH